MKHIDAEILDVLIQCSELLDDSSDVNDGDDGQPVANRAMSLKARVDDVIAKHQTTLNVLTPDVVDADALRRPFMATGTELEFYQLAIERWRTMSSDAVLTEAARLFHFAVAVADVRATGEAA